MTCFVFLFYYRCSNYNNNPNLPVYKHTRCRYNAQRIAEVLLNPELPVAKIATTRPVCVQDNVAFVVDLSKLQKREDIRADDMGSWKCNGKRFIKCAVEGSVIDIVTQPRRRDGNLYTLVRRYYEHTTSSDFKKTIAEIIGKYYSARGLAS